MLKLETLSKLVNLTTKVVLEVEDPMGTEVWIRAEGILDEFSHLSKSWWTELYKYLWWLEVAGTWGIGCGAQADADTKQQQQQLNLSPKQVGPCYSV